MNVFFSVLLFLLICCLLSLIFCIRVAVVFCDKGLLSLLSYKVTGCWARCGRNVAAPLKEAIMIRDSVGFTLCHLCGNYVSVSSDLFWHCGSELTDADVRVHMSVGVSGFLTPCTYMSLEGHIWYCVCFQVNLAKNIVWFSFVFPMMQWEPVQYFNNKIICDLVEEKFKGIISILVRRCHRGVQNCWINQKNSAYFKRTCD